MTLHLEPLPLTRAEQMLRLTPVGRLVSNRHHVNEATSHRTVQPPLLWVSVRVALLGVRRPRTSLLVAVCPPPHLHVEPTRHLAAHRAAARQHAALSWARSENAATHPSAPLNRRTALH